MWYQRFILQHGDKKLTLKFSILQLALWSTWCSFFSFAAMFFVNKGYSYSFTGAALSVAIGCGIAGQIFWGFLCDKLRSIKKAYIIVNIFLLVAVLSLSHPISPLHILISTGFLGFCQIPQPAVLDSWILKKNVKFPLNYGFIRMWASIGFSVFGWIVGLGMVKIGYWVMFIFATFFILCTVIVSLLTADADGSIEAVKLGNMVKSYRKLLKNKNYLLFLAACFIIGLGTQATDNLMSLIVTEVGGNAGDQGMILFFTAITELPFFFFSTKIFSRFSSRQCFLFTGCAYVLQYLFIALADSTVMVAIGMMFQGIGFSVLLPNIRNFAYQNAPEELRTSGQTITDALYTGLAGVVAASFGAVIIQYTGVTVLYSICIGFVVLAMGLFMRVTAGKGIKNQDIANQDSAV